MKYIFWVIKGDVLNLLNYLHLESKHVHIFLFGLKIHKNVLYLQLDESNKKVFDGCLSQHKTDSSCFVSRDKALITACAFYSIKKGLPDWDGNLSWQMEFSLENQQFSAKSNDQ
jgi:hypothetical protein